jgi:phenylpropionate dioxygenase-like ring-hydroxylating dioxygenase large terminal subunit
VTATAPDLSADARPKRAQAIEAMRRSWFPVARSADLEAGGAPQAAELLGEKLVVYRGEDGRARVASRRCPHRGGDLSIGKVHGGDVACPYHGWRFSGEDGRCVMVPSLADQSRVPPRAAIRAYPAVERFAHVWTVLEEPLHPLYDPVEWRDLDLVWLEAEPLHTTTGVGVAMENFRDVAHFPFVHEVSMGPSPAVVEPLEVRRDGLDVYMDRPLHASNGDWAAQGDCMMNYHCIAPGFAAITYDYERFGKRIVTGFPSPVAYDRCIIYWSVACERSFSGDPIEEQLRVEDMVFREDMPIVAELEPSEIPWDGEYEEHSVPADLFTLNYRRAFGTLIAEAAAGANGGAAGGAGAGGAAANGAGA